MAGHTSEKRWVTRTVNGAKYTGVSEIASEVSRALVKTLYNMEETYLELLEIYNYAGGTDTDLANLLFKEDIAQRSESVANQEEIDKASDLVAAMTAAHQLYQAANNTATTQADRFALLRRIS